MLAVLHGHGAAPTDHTRPELVHEFVSDLYRFEIRRLRDRLIAGDVPRTEYASRVVSLRTKYQVISMRAAEWLER